jgi:signal transduction histidine kinase
MLAERRGWPLATRWADAAWALFSAINLGVMIAAPGWETIPFHFIWVSLTLLYGYRVWSLRRTAWILAVVVAATAAPIAADAMSRQQPTGELAEVPLMAAMFLAMVWHARRRVAAIHELERLSDTNTRLLERERRFLQDASHELRTPITVALGHAELIARASTNPAIAEDARVVVDEMGRMRSLAEHLLLLASAEQPTFLSRRQIAPSTVVQAAIRRWAPIPRRWTLLEDPTPFIDADPDRLASALDALIENAVSYTGEGEGIELRLLMGQGSVRILVSDEGTGIAPEDLEQIFGRFARADDARERNRAGMGLGLSIAKTIVEAHGGVLRVRSEQGRGSTFELDLPTSAEAAALPVTSEGTALVPAPHPVGSS